MPSPNFNLKTILGLCLVITTSLLIAISTILLKKLNVFKVDTPTIFIYVAYVGVPVTLLWSLIFNLLNIEKRPIEYLEDKWTFILQCIYLVLSASSSFLTQFFLNFAIKYEEPAKVSIIRMSDLLITFVLQSAILSIYSNLFSVLGALLIFTSTCLVIIYKILYNKSEFICYFN